MVLVKSNVSSIKWYTLGKKTKPKMNKTKFLENFQKKEKSVINILLNL